MFLTLDGLLWQVPGGGSVSAGAGYHLLLALWSDVWIPASVSTSATATLSFSLGHHSHSHDGGHGHHKHYRWFDDSYFRVEDDYWAERERMMRRHVPQEPRVLKEAQRTLPAEKPVPLPEVAALAQKHDRILLLAKEVFDLDTLGELSHQLDTLSAQIADYQLQSDDEALTVLLLS